MSLTELIISALEGPLKGFIEKEIKKFKNILDRYHEYDENEGVDEIEKENYRKRIAAQLCKILKILEPKKDVIDDYSDLEKIFCKIIPAV
jgi:predicted NUDIX family phosphoesterase